MGDADLPGGRKLFAGPRDDPFFVDLGSIFDLAGLRPFNAAHLIPLATAKGDDGVEHYNTHAIAIQVPKTDLLQREPAGDPRPERQRDDLELGRLVPGLAAREPADQRGDHPAR